MTMGGRRNISVTEIVSHFEHGAKSAIVDTAVQITTFDRPAKDGVLVKSSNANTETVFVGNSGVTRGTADGSDGFEIGAGESVVIPVDNANKVFVRAPTAAEQRVSWIVA